jgi:hypothetical protein
MWEINKTNREVDMHREVIRMANHFQQNLQDNIGPVWIIL